MSFVSVVSVVSVVSLHALVHKRGIFERRLLFLNWSRVYTPGRYQVVVVFKQQGRVGSPKTETLWNRLPGRLALRTGFEPVTYRLTGSRPQKHRSVDFLWPEKPVHTIAKCGSAKKLSGHSCTEPVGQYFHKNYITSTSYIAPPKRLSNCCDPIITHNSSWL